MSGIPSLTILSEEQKFNGDNLLQWKNNITQLLGAKGLLGYIDGKILKPTGSYTSDTPITCTPIYSTTPSLDEWNFRDQLTRGHITLNCTDIASLGVITTGTAMDAWNSIENEWGKSTDMRRSHAQEALNRTEYNEGTDIQEHIKLLRTRKAAVNNLSTSAMNDETWRGIIIRSIPPTPKWLPVIPSLYSMTTSADIVSTLLAHGMILGRGTMNPYSTALTAQTKEGCKNPNCKARDPSTHTTEDCYWPGGGKEGQFPANFGQRSKANITVSSPQTEHFALSARIPKNPGQSGILIDEPNIYHTPIKQANVNQPGTTDITDTQIRHNTEDHNIKHELDIITKISDAPPPAPQSSSHPMSASVGEHLTPLTVVTKIEPIVINHQIHHTVIQIRVNITVNDIMIPTITTTIPNFTNPHYQPTYSAKTLLNDTTNTNSGSTTINHHDVDHHDQVINNAVDIIDDQQDKATVIPMKSTITKPTDNIFVNNSSTDKEVRGERNEIGKIWETRDSDMGENREIRTMSVDQILRQLNSLGYELVTMENAYSTIHQVATNSTVTGSNQKRESIVLKQPISMRNSLVTATDCRIAPATIVNSDLQTFPNTYFNLQDKYTLIPASQAFPTSTFYTTTIATTETGPGTDLVTIAPANFADALWELRCYSISKKHTIPTQLSHYDPVKSYRATGRRVGLEVSSSQRSQPEYHTGYATLFIPT